ncbi:hypothetical protein M3Y99_00174800 [Aphelenchoides fujianensis]|nr:hypothetical protein M3Y99_00174800 [Aphelenchoides fujianensis]
MSGGYANRTPAPPFYAFSNSTPPPHWRQPTDSHLPELAPLEALGELMASLRSTTPIPPVESTTIATKQTTVDPPVERAIEHGETNVIGTTEVVGEPEKEAITTTGRVQWKQRVDVGDVTDPPPVGKPEVKGERNRRLHRLRRPPLSPGDVEEAAPEEQPADSIGGGPESGEIRASREGQQIRLDWEPPEQALCDNFLVNTTVVDLQPPRSFSTASGSSYSYVKFHSGHKLHIHVSCLYEGVVSSVWSAEKELDLRKPKPVENLRVKSMYTDEFYVSSVVLAIDWPRGHDFEQFEVSVVWAAGKKAIGSNKAVFNKSGDLLIEKLEPATMYTFAVRNVSKQLGLTSSPMGIRSTTPPIITSTLFPGQISSYAININFGESEPEHKFDGYELVFAGNTRNITKKLAKSDPRSRSTNSSPGRTYTFVLYTVYKNIKSRPVVEEITTYPLKVKSFNPIVGPGYVTLFWEVDNLGEERYTSTSNTGIRKTQKTQLKDVNKYRFSGLDYDTYYTFTITVVMGRGKAEAESESEMVTIGFNQKPISLPTLQRRGSRELLLTFENDPRIFSDTNGVVDNFAIIVSEDLKLGGDDFHLKSYYDVKDELHWPAYRASVSTYNPFKKRGASRTATFRDRRGGLRSTEVERTVLQRNPPLACRLLREDSAPIWSRTSRWKPSGSPFTGWSTRRRPKKDNAAFPATCT